MAFSHRFDPTTLREYDIRGIVGRTLSARDAFAIGRCFGSLVVRDGGRTVAVGRDGRLSGPELEAALVDTARVVVTRYFARRGRTVTLPEAAPMQGAFEQITTTRSQARSEARPVVVYVEMKASLAGARRAFLQTVRHFVGAETRLNEQEILAILEAYMQNPGAADSGTAEPETPAWPAMRASGIRRCPQDAGRARA